VARSTLWILIVAGTLALATSASTPPRNLDRTLAAQFELVAEQSDNAVAHNDLGNLLVLAGRLQEAEEAYRKAIELDPGYTSAHFNLGVLLQQAGRAREAEEQFERLLEIDSFHAWGHYQLGVVLDRGGHRSAALEHYARALAYDPTLSFDSDNPHIIENRLFAEALLRSQRYSAPPGSRVPRQYGEPERIIKLLLDEEDEDTGEEAAAETPDERGTAPLGELPDEIDREFPDEGEEPRDGTTAQRPAADSQIPAGATRVLTNTNIETGSQLGRSQQTGSSRVRPPTPSTVDRSELRRRLTRPPATPDSGQPSTPSVRRPAGRESITPGGTVVAPPPARDSTTPGSVAPPQPSAPQPSSRYRPGRRSTAQLELKLLPEESPQEYAVGARG